MPNIEDLRNQIAAEIKVVESAIGQRQEQITKLEGDNTAARSRINRLRETLSVLEDALLKVDQLGELTLKGKKTSGIARPKRGTLKTAVLTAIIAAGAEGISFNDLVAKANSNGVVLTREQISQCLHNQKVEGIVKQGFDSRWREARFLPDTNV